MPDLDVLVARLRAHADDRVTFPGIGPEMREALRAAADALRALRATPSELTTDQKALVREVDRRFAEALEPSDEEVARELAKDEHYNLFHPNERMKWATEAVRAVYAARQRAKENK